MEVLGFEISLFWLLCAIGLPLLYIYYTRKFGVFKSMGIKGPTPIPLLGSGGEFMIKGFRNAFVHWEKKFGNIYGLYLGTTPNLVVSDDDILKEVLVKSFSHFTNRNVQAFNKDTMDEVSSCMLSILEDDQWKRVRNILTTTFSSAKLRRMMQSASQCSEILVDNINDDIEQGKEVNIQDHAGAYTMDVILRVGFGIQVDTKDHTKLPLISSIKSLLNPRLTSPKMILRLFFPKLIQYLKNVMDTSFLPEVFLVHFEKMVQDAIKMKENSTEKHKDILQIMVNAQNDAEIDVSQVSQEFAEMGATYDHSQIKKGMTKNEMLGQCVVFFFAGYSTVMDGLSFLIYSLAINPDCQEKAYQEAVQVMEDADESKMYEAINKLEYIDMCLSETLRLYPLAPNIDRICGEDITIKGIHIKKGMVVMVPVQSIHMNPKIWPDPEKYDPERFSSELKAERSQFAWLPFGFGPRSCVAQRLAIMEIKLTMAKLLLKFKFSPTDKTEIPLDFGTQFRYTKNFHLSVESRE